MKTNGMKGTTDPNVLAAIYGAIDDENARISNSAKKAPAKSASPKKAPAKKAPAKK